MKNIAMAKPDISEKEVEAAAQVVRSGQLALGKKIKEFEKMFCEITGRKHAIAVSSGTAGLHLSLMAYGIGPGDEVLVPSYTFVASVNCILYVGAVPVFVDIDKDDLSISIKDIEAKRSSKTKAIVCVDVFGHPAKLDKLDEYAKANNLVLVDDSCEALGAQLNGKPVGSFGDIASFAFYPNKQITTGEGGMLVLDDDEKADLIRAKMNQGRGQMGKWLEHITLGYNYRMSEVQAAIGVEQLKRLDEILGNRQRVADKYNSLLGDCKFLTTQFIAKNVKMSWFVFVVTLNKGMDRAEFIDKLGEKSIPARAYFTPIHTQPYLKDYETRGEEYLPHTIEMGERTVALPFHGLMTDEEIEYVCDVINKMFIKSDLAA